jgi:hypothetical protein
VSAKRCNQLLGRKSAFWMDETYDHIVRDTKELAAFRHYIASIHRRQDCLRHGRQMSKSTLAFQPPSSFSTEKPCSVTALTSAR